MYWFFNIQNSTKNEQVCQGVINVINKIKAKGGHGGHNGIRSIIGAAGGGEFPRIRVGIGRPDTHIDVTDHVLGKFAKDETSLLESVLTIAGDAAQEIINKGLTLSMNKFNRNVVGSDNH